MITLATSEGSTFDDFSGIAKDFSRDDRGVDVVRGCDLISVLTAISPETRVVCDLTGLRFCG